MATFITLTLTSGHSIRVNSELMTSYSADVASFSEQRGSYVRMYEPYTDPAKYDFFVTETPEQIDKMLGVTDNAKMVAALVHCRELLIDHPINEVDGEELAEKALGLINDALAARGE